ncbi:MAG TPA: efflux RND transporter periplasmic adaptor subunit [Thermoanaerobaculia bacterium]|nr:efflux RND transporter periplasmic adaptor subunit [Thermoanaerobaculia bacterium]HUM30372.1 efflux RND transporter periplasmic adaptor subunit [Thermoanaerobaculia bacterium]HXK68617.1 efflux RND transporter periplasmic adaptor subunit [Thermoanaerobaculia bacterium]
MKRWILRAVWVLIGIGILYGAKLLFFAPKEIPVRAVTAELGTVEETVTNTRAGTVKVRTRASLSPQIGGRVISIPFRKGQSVHKGELLLRLDDSVQRAELALAKEDVVLTRAQQTEACLAANLAFKEWERGRSLAQDGISTEQQLDVLSTERDRTKAACDAATAAISQAEARVKLSQTYLDQTEIRAPFDGVIADLSTEVGEWITPSPPGVPIPAVIDLLDASSVYISAPIDEMDSERVSVGQKAYLTVDSRRGQKFMGTVVRVAPYVLDQLEQNRTVEVEAEFDDASNADILPGTSADVEIILNRKEDVLRIPTSAISDDNVVLVIEGDRLREQKIKTGLSNWQETEVIDGLKQGDRVVEARDSTSIKAGARVTVSPSS